MNVESSSNNAVDRVDYKSKVMSTGDTIARSDINPEAMPVDETYSLIFLSVMHQIETGIEISKSGGYADLKIRTASGMRPLGEYLAVDLFKVEGMTTEEKRLIIDIYRPIIEEYLGAPRPSTAREKQIPAYISTDEPRPRELDGKARGSGERYDD